MSGWMKTVAITAAAVVLMAVGKQPAQSQYYDGKTITFIVGAPPGGELDIYTRLIARHLGKHVPGNPTIIVQHRPGAGSLLAANYIYNAAPPDGLTIGTFASAVVLQQVVGEQQAMFDGRNFGWLGTPSTFHTVCFLAKARGLTTVEQWLAAKQPPALGGMGPGAAPSDMPRLLNAAIGLPLRLVEGYTGGPQRRIALERGEVDGFCGAWQSTKRALQDDIKVGKFLVLLQATVQSHPELTDVPLAIDFAKTEEARQLITIGDTVHNTGYVYAISPKTPNERLQILRTAFVQTMKSPELLGEAKTAGLEIDLLDGSTTAQKLGGLYDLPASMVSKLKQILVRKEK